MNRHSLNFCALSIASALMATGAQAQPATTVEAPTLSLSAFGETAIKPDIASLDLGVDTTETTAAKAMSANARRMTQVIAALKGAGIAEADLQTSGLNLSPQYAYEQNLPPRLTGFQVTNHVSVVTRDLSRLGAVVDSLTAAGANTIGGIRFSLANPLAAEDVARLAAVKALEDKAALYTRATGYHASRLIHLNEGVEFSPGPRPLPMMTMKAMAAPSTPIEAGEVKVRVDITGTFALER